VERHLRIWRTRIECGFFVLLYHVCDFLLFDSVICGQQGAIRRHEQRADSTHKFARRHAILLLLLCW
jgi:hypothetical protein